MDSEKTLPAVLVVVGGVLLVVGSFLPWLTVTALFVGTVTRNGLDNGGDGWLTLIAGVILIAMGVSYYRTDPAVKLRRPGKAILPWAGVTLVLVIVEWSRVSDRIGEADFGEYGIASVGIGIYLMALGAVAAGVGGFLVYRSPEVATPTVPPAPPAPLA